MTTIAPAGVSPREVATTFFSAYDARDVIAMAELCSPTAEFRYEPYELSGKQRVLRGVGKVGTVGRPIWAGEFAAFPDASLRVTSLEANDDGLVVAEVERTGHQAGPWLTTRPSGAEFTSHALFVLQVTDGRIHEVTAYWDNGTVLRQLGHHEID